MRSLLGPLLNRSPVPLAASPGRMVSGMGGTPNNQVAQMAMMGAVGTLFGIVNRTSNGTAKVNWRLWRNLEPRRGRSDGTEPEREEVTRHAALDLWRKPNPFMARQELVEATQQHIDLTGEGWWIVGRDPRASIPLELWPVRPDRMAPVPDPYEFMSGYVYKGPEGQLIPLGLDEVIQIKMPNPLDPYRGMGPVQAIMAVADSRRYSIEWNRNFFINSAEPGGFVVFDKSLSDTEFLKWQERWREQHRGVAAAHRVGVLENATFVERKYSQKDMQFAELVNATGTLMREAFGIHKASLGGSDDVNRSNAEAARWLFAEEITVPRLDRLKGKINNQLLPMFDADPALEFDYDDPRPSSAEQENADRDSRVAAAMAVVAAGGDWDAALAAFGLPPIPRSSVPAAVPTQLDAILATHQILAVLDRLAPVIETVGELEPAAAR